MWEPDFDYIMLRWDHFRAKLNATQRSIIINREFYVHWIDSILNREVYLRDPVGNVHTVWYPPLANENPVVVPPPIPLAENEEPQVIDNGQPADIVGWDVVASQPFASGDKPLYIPAHVVDIMHLRRQRSLALINDARIRMQATILKRKKRTIRERYLGLGWYEFCRNLHIQVGQTVQFRFYGNPHELRVSVV
ncbi:DNA-binding barrel domain superfamily [Sesbania bispinosa]|nr:DNA-binding barrel domain superfamily [Sesbania bispinosa]